MDRYQCARRLERCSASRQGLSHPPCDGTFVCEKCKGQFGSCKRSRVACRTCDDCVGDVVDRSFM